MKAKRSVILVAIIFIVAGCASIIHGTRQKVSFSSTPASATVYVDGMVEGKTPMVKELKRKKSHTIKIELEGFQPYVMTVDKKFSGWYVGNLLFGGIIGLIVDAANGAMYKLSPDQVQAAMSRGTMGADLRDGALYIAVVLEVDPTWEKIGSLRRSDVGR